MDRPGASHGMARRASPLMRSRYRAWSQQKREPRRAAGVRACCGSSYPALLVSAILRVGLRLGVTLRLRRLRRRRILGRGTGNLRRIHRRLLGAQILEHDRAFLGVFLGEAGAAIPGRRRRIGGGEAGRDDGSYPVGTPPAETPVRVPPVWEPPPPKPRPCPKADALVDESAKLPSDAMAARARMVDLRDMWFSWGWCGRGPLFHPPIGRRIRRLGSWRRSTTCR